MSFSDVINVMLPPTDGISSHVTGNFGEVRPNGPHGGVDFNYTGGQSGTNLSHPTVNSPVDGVVTFSGGNYGTIKIRDSQGNSHEILHTNSQSVRPGDNVSAGQPIGTMGGKGPSGSSQYAQHVHYQMKDPNGNLINPQDWWNTAGNNQADVSSGYTGGPFTDPNPWWDGTPVPGDANGNGIPDILESAKDKFGAGKRQSSPIILDLDGDGVETTKVNQGAWFDHDGNGFAESTGWVGKDDGLLVRDVDGSGYIDVGSELFGNNTKLSNGKLAANGFEALKDLDAVANGGNADGKIDSNDAAWASLKIWKDANGDGYHSDGEVISLAEASVQSLNVAYSNSIQVDANGNSHRQLGSLTKTDGTTGKATDVWFAANDRDWRGVA